MSPDVPIAPTLFVFTAQAVADSGAGFPPGERHALLIFATAATREEADPVAVSRVQAEGWVDVTLLRSKSMSEDVAAIADGTVRAAAQSALDDGCGFVVYSDPLPHDA